MKWFKRFCTACKEYFYCNNACGSVKEMGEATCYCKWCVEELSKINEANFYMVMRHHCEHIKHSSYVVPEKVEFT